MAGLASHDSRHNSAGVRLGVKAGLHMPARNRQ